MFEDDFPFPVWWDMLGISISLVTLLKKKRSCWFFNDFNEKVLLIFNDVLLNDAFNAKVKESTWRVVKRLADNWWINVFALASLKAEPAASGERWGGWGVEVGTPPWN